MFKKFLLLLFLISACTLNIKAQSDTLYLYSKLKRHINLSKWGIPPGNYSGITYLGHNKYAVITDKPQKNGFYIFEINISDKGKVTSVQNCGFHSDSIQESPRDMEGITYVPQSRTLFISAESDQQIIEYTLEGQQTGRRLNIPKLFDISNIQANYGFESLTYSPHSHKYWTTTENALLSDINHSNPRIMLRIQSFTEDLQPSIQYQYLTDTPKKAKKKYKHYAFGVPAITALPDGSLLVLERELYIPRTYLTSSVKTKIYQIYPDSPNLSKRLITSFRTPINKLSNYEGMCLGPILSDGSQTLILICDSQNQAGNKFYHLKDRIRIILLKRKKK